MNLTCKGILSLPYANQLRLVAGKDGQDNVVSWVYYMEDAHYVDWLKGGELVIFTGLVTKEREDKLLEYIEALAEYGVSGIVINLSYYITTIPESVLKRCDELGLPLFEMDENIRIIDVTQNICYAIFNRGTNQYDVGVTLFGILYGSYMTAQRLQRLQNAGYKPKEHYVAVVVRLLEGDEKAEIDEFGLYTEKTLQREYKRIEEIIGYVTNSLECLVTTDDDRLVWAQNAEDKTLCTSQIESLAVEIAKRMKKFRFEIGVGSRFVDLKNLMESVQNAEIALKMSNVENQIKPIYYSDQILIRIFDKFEDKSELYDIAHKILKELMDDKNEELLQSLEIYLRENCNIKAASQCLFIHENTMHYRIKKISALIGADLKSHNDLFYLRLAMEILKAQKAEK